MRRSNSFFPNLPLSVVRKVDFDQPTENSAMLSSYPECMIDRLGSTSRMFQGLIFMNKRSEHFSNVHLCAELTSLSFWAGSTVKPEKAPEGLRTLLSELHRNCFPTYPPMICICNTSHLSRKLRQST